MAKKKNKEMIVENSDATPAAASLHPGAAPSDGGSFDPTKSEVMAQALAIMGGMSKDDLNGFMASLSQAAHAADTIPGGAQAHNRGTIVPKPSFAVGSVHEEDISALFEGQEVSEEFVERATKIFEAALETRLAVELTNLQEQYEGFVEEAYEDLSEEMADKLDQYLNYTVSEWMKENELVLERGVKNEIMESFVEGLKNLFAEHYIEVPEDKVDAVELLSGKVAELEAKLNDVINDNISLSEEMINTKKFAVFESVAADLSEGASERLALLAENLEFKDPEDFASKLEVLKESVVGNSLLKKGRASTGMLTEDVFHSEEEIKEMNAPVLNNEMAAVVQHLSKTAKKL